MENNNYHWYCFSQLFISRRCSTGAAIVLKLAYILLLYTVWSFKLFIQPEISKYSNHDRIHNVFVLLILIIFKCKYFMWFFFCYSNSIYDKKNLHFMDILCIYNGGFCYTCMNVAINILEVYKNYKWPILFIS